MKEDIIEELNNLVDSGRLINKASLIKDGMDYGEINRKELNKEFLVTQYESIVAIDIDARDWFVEKVKEGRIMDKQQAKLQGLISYYEREKACKTGELIKFLGFGRGCVLYIN